MSLFEALLVVALGALAMLLVAECLKLRRTAAQPAAAPPSAPAAPPSPWTALPGGRLELGASGFAITLHTGMSGSLYHLWSPEGRLIHHCFDLLYLKALGERFAAERDEFARVAKVALPPLHH